MNFQNNYTSLHWASQEGQAKIAKFLISAGASLEAVDKVYNIHVAIWCFFTVFAAVGMYTFTSCCSARKISSYGCSY